MPSSITTSFSELHDACRPIPSILHGQRGRDLDKLLEVRALGVTRVGASRTKEMLDECKRQLG
tara:strand:- start:290 stop:478 length:189 start_codon:yes stop_codon:yes gene_type:complete